MDAKRKSQLAFALTEDVIDEIRDSVLEVLDTDTASVKSRISEIEVLLKTDQHEMLLLNFDTVSQAVSGLVAFMDERSDVSDLLDR